MALRGLKIIRTRKRFMNDKEKDHKKEKITIFLIAISGIILLYFIFIDFIFSIIGGLLILFSCCYSIKRDI
jgi:hypothetical protein